MMKAKRRLALFLILTIVCGIICAASAEVVTLGIYLCGRKTAEDGSEIIVRLDGRFRVTRNGEDAGIIEAGKTVLTLQGTDRIRVEPLAESISPGWDLRNAYREITPEAGGTTTVSIILDPLEGDGALPEPTPEPTAQPAEAPDEGGEAEQPEDTDEAGEEPEEDDEEDVPPSVGTPAATPTLPPFDASLVAPTPEPEWKPLPAGSGSLKVLAFYDQNNNGLAGETEKAIADVTVCLFTEAEEAVAAAVTGADGVASFDGLPDGMYRIKAILPRGWAFNRKGTEPEPYASLFGSSIEGEAMSEAFAVSAEAGATAGISLTKCLHVSGECWFETVNDGLLKSGEPMLGGVRIELTGEKNGLQYETISGEDGSWYIDRVMPAAYKLTAHAPDGMMFARVSKTGGKRSVLTKDGVGVASRRVDLNDNESKEKMYIGFTWSGQVSGICFLDANYNGVYDEGEPPMPGVKVTAIKQSKEEEAAVAFSGEDGTYTLVGLRGNTYKMRALLPDDGSDFTCTVSDPLGNHFEARPGRRENFWTNYVLADAEQREMNVGVIYPATVTGTVYQDDDFSGTLNGKEKIVSGYLVKLLDENGNTVAMDKTSVKGKFELTKIPPGRYSLSVTALKDYAFTRLGEGNVILNRTNGEGYSEPFDLTLGENRAGMDIGMIRPGTVEGMVFADRNDNGLRDEGENGLPGVTVSLMSAEGEAFRTEIGEDGRYLFDAVMPGSYWLEYTLPENAVFAQTAAGGNTVSGDRTGRSDFFEMTSGRLQEGPGCGALTLGYIEGCAWQDHDGDGIPSDGEEKAAGITLTLTPSRADLQEITVTTGEDGAFMLASLRPDTYTLTVSCDDGRVVSRTDNLALPLTAGRAEQSVSLTVPMGAVWINQQLGTVIPSSLKGQLWLDENNNGLFDEGESTPSGCEITVTDDRTGKIFDQLYTDGEGRFATSGMIPGSFTLSFPLDADTIAPKPGSSHFVEEAGRLIFPGLKLAEDEYCEGILLGIVRYTAIGGNVWIDRGDAVTALSGAEITLKDEAGSELATLVTDGNGAYRFDRLMPGTYTLEAVMPEGCVIIEPGDQRLSGGQISVMTHILNRTGSGDPIVLKMAENQLQMNIGCVLPGRMGDFCWLDLDGDGLQGMNEPGIPNVRIELMRNGETVMETLTDQYGFYRFQDLYPAVYTLRVTPPAEVKPTAHRTDIRMIASVLEETEDAVCISAEIQVESDRANYNADLGFVCRQEGVLPPGAGEGKTQDWTATMASE